MRPFLPATSQLTGALGVALGATSDTELPRVVQVAGYRLVRGTGGSLVGMVVPKQPVARAHHLLTQDIGDIEEPTYNAGLIGARGRFHPGQRPKPHRVYLLTGVISCENSHPMHGQCRVSWGQEWRYYICRGCAAPSVPADDAEWIVVDAIKEMTLPPRAIDQARAELARRLEVPDADLVGTKRRRLETRLSRLTQMFGWGDLDGDDYRRQVSETRTMLAELPDANKLVAFDRASIEWTPRARPFFQEGALVWRPRTGAGRLSPYRLHERLVAYT